MRFRIKGPRIIHETIDGEAVIVNLDTGYYYSLDKVSADIWNLIEANASFGEILEVITSRYDTTGADPAGAITPLLDQLREEGLITTDASGRPGDHATPLPPHAPRETRPPFEVPLLHKYSDMEELLLLDPIHDVDDSGWPNKNPEETKT